MQRKMKQATINFTKCLIRLTKSLKIFKTK